MAAGGATWLAGTSCCSLIVSFAGQLRRPQHTIPQPTPTCHIPKHLTPSCPYASISHPSTLTPHCCCGTLLTWGPATSQQHKGCGGCTRVQRQEVKGPYSALQLTTASGGSKI